MEEPKPKKSGLVATAAKSLINIPDSVLTLGRKRDRMKSSWPILTGFRKVGESSQKSSSSHIEDRHRNDFQQGPTTEKYHPQRPVRSLSFCNLLLPPRRGKLKISQIRKERDKQDSNLYINLYNKKTSNTNYNNFLDGDSELTSNKYKGTRGMKKGHSEAVLNKKISETSPPKTILFNDGQKYLKEQRRLSLIEAEIDSFEKQFIAPMNKSVSSSNISQTRGRRNQATKKSFKQVKGKPIFMSNDSLFSEMDSGAFSRDSTPDFSIKSGITDYSEPLVAPRLVISSISRDKEIKENEYTEDPPKILTVIQIQKNSVHPPGVNRDKKPPSPKYQHSGSSSSNNKRQMRPLTFTERVFSNNYPQSPNIEHCQSNNVSYSPKQKNNSFDYPVTDHLSPSCSTPKITKGPEQDRPVMLAKSHSFVHDSTIKRTNKMVRSNTFVTMGMSYQRRNAARQKEGGCSRGCPAEVTVNGVCFHK